MIRALLLALILSVPLACAKPAQPSVPTATEQPAPTQFAEQSAAPTATAAEAVKEEPQTPQPTEEPAMKEVLQLYIDGTPVTVAWEDNTSVDALKELAAFAPLVIRMSMYGGFEQVGPIGSRLPRDDVDTRTQAGDIVLYSGNQIVVFYGTNSWAYTRLGHITDHDAAGMAELLSHGDVTLTLQIEQQ